MILRRAWALFEVSKSRAYEQLAGYVQHKFYPVSLDSASEFSTFQPNNLKEQKTTLEVSKRIMVARRGLSIACEAMLHGLLPKHL